MINDHDRDALQRIKADLARGDPAFAARMQPEQRLGGYPTVFAVCALFYIGVPIAALLFGWTGVMVMAAGAAAGIIAALVHRRSPGESILGVPAEDRRAAVYLSSPSGRARLDGASRPRCVRGNHRKRLLRVR